MSITHDDDEGIISGINVTPLVDITLVLLIVFMVTAKIIVSQSMTLELPSAASGTSVQLVFGVEVDEAGAVRVNGEPIAEDRAIVALARASLRDNPEVRAVIRADQRVQHGRIIRVLDLLKQAGVTKIAFGVDPAAREAEPRQSEPRAGTTRPASAPAVGAEAKVAPPDARAGTGT